jgi:hypothetical protein
VTTSSPESNGDFVNHCYRGLHINMPVDDVNAVKASLNAFRGHLTRAIGEAERLCDFVHHSPNAFNIQKLEAAFDALELKYSNVELRLVRLQELDPDSFDTYKQKINEVEQEYRLAGDATLRVLIEAKMPPAPLLTAPPAGAAGAAAARRVAKIDVSLKPFQLSMDHTPVELRSWVSRYRSYYSTNTMDNLIIENQQAYFKDCLDPKLEARVNTKLQPDTPIFGHDSCTEILQNEFLVLYPLFTRRFQFFAHRQAQGQVFSEYEATLRQKGDEADLQTLTVDDIYVFRYVCGSCNNELQKKFLRLLNPTLNDLQREVRAYEVAANVIKELDHPATVNKVSARTSTKMPYRKKEDIKGRCFRCGSPDHTADCPIPKADLLCENCGKTGHVSSVCMSFRRPKQTLLSPAPPGGTRPPTPDSEDDSEDDDKFSAKTSMVYTSQP